MTARQFLFLLGSSRTGGNTERLAERAAASLPDGTEQRWLRLSEHLPAPFEDRRHGGGPAIVPAGAERILLDATLAATDIVIASPLYWYSVSASTKLYLDHWSGWIRDEAAGFRARMAGKNLWGISVLAERDRAQAEPLVGMLRRSADYLNMRWGGVLLGNGSKPGDILRDDVALAGASSFFADDDRAPVGAAARLGVA